MEKYTWNWSIFSSFCCERFPLSIRLHIHQLLVSARLIHSIHLFLGSFDAAYDFRQLKLLYFLHSYVFHSWYVFFRMLFSKIEHFHRLWLMHSSNLFSMLISLPPQYSNGTLCSFVCIPYPSTLNFAAWKMKSRGCWISTSSSVWRNLHCEQQNTQEYVLYTQE